MRFVKYLQSRSAAVGGGVVASAAVLTLVTMCRYKYLLHSSSHQVTIVMTIIMGGEVKLCHVTHYLSINIALLCHYRVVWCVPRLARRRCCTRLEPGGGRAVERHQGWGPGQHRMPAWLGRYCRHTV